MVQVPSPDLELPHTAGVGKKKRKKPFEKNIEPDGFVTEFSQEFKDKLTMLSKFFPKNQKKDIS